MTIIFKIEGTEREITLFALPEMSLSSARSRMERREFKVQIGGSELLALLREDYEQWVIESKEDDQQCGAPQDELALAGYPELEKVLNDSELLNLVVGGYLFDNLIEKFSAPSERIVFWWDEVTSCSYDKENIVINGICYNKKIT